MLQSTETATNVNFKATQTPSEKARILKLPEVIQRTALSKTSIYALIQTKQFPKQIKLSVRSVGWLESDVDSWLDARINGAGA